jgi:hypothetical protein
MSTVTQARQKLRDLAREEVCVFTSLMEEAGAVVKISSLGEIAGPLFVAVQEALRVAEELRAESRAPVSTSDRYSSLQERTTKDAQAAAADRIEAAVFMALAY